MRESPPDRRPRKTAGRAPGIPPGRMPRPRRAVRRMSPAPGRLPSPPSPLQGGVPAPLRAASRAAPAGIPRAALSRGTPPVSGRPAARRPAFRRPPRGRRLSRRAPAPVPSFGGRASATRGRLLAEPGGNPDLAPRTRMCAWRPNGNEWNQCSPSDPYGQAPADPFLMPASSPRTLRTPPPPPFRPPAGSPSPGFRSQRLRSRPQTHVRQRKVPDILQPGTGIPMVRAELFPLGSRVCSALRLPRPPQGCPPLGAAPAAASQPPEPGGPRSVRAVLSRTSSPGGLIRGVT